MPAPVVLALFVWKSLTELSEKVYCCFQPYYNIAFFLTTTGFDEFNEAADECNFLWDSVEPEL